LFQNYFKNNIISHVTTALREITQQIRNDDVNIG